MKQHPVGPGLGLEHDLAAIGYQDLRPGSPLAGLHVLGEDEYLVAGRLDDRVEVAGDDQGRGLEVLGIGDLHHVNPGLLELLQLITRLDRLVLCVTLDIHGPFGVCRDQPDIERFHVLEPVLLAEVRLGVELVGREGELLEVPGRDLEAGNLTGSKRPRGEHGERPRFHHRDPLLGLRPPGLDRDLLESLDGARTDHPSRSRRPRP